MNKPITRMLKELLPGRNSRERERILLCCTAFPTLGTGQMPANQYRRQIEECLRERPDDPIAWAEQKKLEIMARLAKEE